jgi:hypothetical protein
MEQRGTKMGKTALVAVVVGFKVRFALYAFTVGASICSCDSFIIASSKDILQIEKDLIIIGALKRVALKHSDVAPRKRP